MSGRAPQSYLKIEQNGKRLVAVWSLHKMEYHVVIKNHLLGEYLRMWGNAHHIMMSEGN